MRKPVESKFQLSPFSLRRAITGIKRPGIESIQQTGLRSDTGICHSGQAKRCAGISFFRARARVRGIPAYPCGETGMTVLG